MEPSKDITEEEERRKEKKRERGEKGEWEVKKNGGLEKMLSFCSHSALVLNVRGIEIPENQNDGNPCREEENLVFWFGAQFISTLNFNQSGWLILFSPDLHFRPPKLVSRQTQSLWLGNADQNRRPSSRSYLAMLFS